MSSAVRAILAIAGVVLLTALVVLGVRGGGDAGDPTAMDTPTEIGSPTDGSTAAGGDSDPLDPTEGTDEDTPSPTDSPDDEATDTATGDAAEPDDGATAADDGDGADQDGDADPTGAESGEDGTGDGSSDAGAGGEEAADDVDDMPDTGRGAITSLAGLALTGLALRLRR